MRGRLQQAGQLPALRDQFSITTALARRRHTWGSRSLVKGDLGGRKIESGRIPVAHPLTQVSGIVFPGI